MYSSSDYTVSSNNSMNDNKYNAQKAKRYGLKTLLKPLLKMLKKKPVQKHHYCPECEDNSANEELESSLLNEIDACHPNSAIFVCDEEGNWDVSPVNKSQSYVPVHFARTEAGTFFWTSMMKTADSDLLSSNCFTQSQSPVEQMPIVFQDRWVQA